MSQFDRMHETALLGFFWNFSRFEYCLKHSSEGRYLKNMGGIAGPNWQAFADAWKHSWNLSEATSDYAYLIDNPPKKQGYEDGSVQWQCYNHRGDPASLLNLTFIVRAVRNNLFHGGKAHGQRLEERDMELLSTSVSFLKKISELDPDVHFLWEEDPPAPDED